MSISLKTLNKGTVVYALLASVFGFVLSSADHIEATIAPVASKETLHVTKHTESEVCWYIQFEKKRNLTPRYFSWVLTIPNKGRHYIAPYRPDGLYRNANTAAKVGKKAWYLNCAKKPKGVGYTFTLRAYAAYETTHGLWTLPRNIGPHKVDGRKEEHTGKSQ